jgi:hypothetical protein
MLADMPEAFGSVKYLLTNDGDFTAAKVGRCMEPKIDPLLAAARKRRHPNWEGRFAESPAPWIGWSTGSKHG